MQAEQRRSSLFNGWASIETLPPLTSEQGFFIETADQDSLVASWEAVNTRLKERIGVILYREHSKLQSRTPLFNGWASLWQPRRDFRVEIYTGQGRTTSSEAIWMTLRDHMMWLWRRERLELIRKARKNPLDFDSRTLRFLRVLGL